MDLFSILTLLGGLALFLYGMEAMGTGLTNLSGGKMAELLSKMTGSRLRAVLLGLIVTSVIQSSSATTVMVVGFVNSGIMKLAQAAGVIMGANIGTTVTAWLISLAGIQGEQLWLRLLKPTSFSPVLAAVGIVLILFSKSSKKKNTGQILVGFAILMFGMNTMSSAVEPLSEDPSFTRCMTEFSNPVLGVLAGTVITAVIQSSSASVGILQALCMTGAVPYAVAVPVIMGQNIGTCVTALLSSIGTSRNARRAAMIHLYFNLIGTTIFLIVFYSVNALAGLPFVAENATPAGIAMIHSIFNISTTILMFPFLDKLVWLANKTVRDKKNGTETEETRELARLDERFLAQPAVAVQQGRTVLLAMAQNAFDSMSRAISLLDGYDRKTDEKVHELEDLTDRYEDALGSYLVKISERELTAEDSEKISVYLQNIGDLERIADHAVNVVDSFREMEEKGIRFSSSAVEDIRVLMNAVSEVMKLTEKAIRDQDVSAARKIEPMEQVVDRLKDAVRERHIVRLREGACTVELGYILADISTDFERVSDHCSNLASSLIMSERGGYDTHEYLSVYRNSGNEEFRREYQRMASRYPLT